eukprot:8427967-Pyramimonas_sp.AAC.1
MGRLRGCWKQISILERRAEMDGKKKESRNFCAAAATLPARPSTEGAPAYSDRAARTSANSCYLSLSLSPICLPPPCTSNPCAACGAVP